MYAIIQSFRSGYFWCPKDQECLLVINICDGVIHCSLSDDDKSVLKEAMS